MDVYLSVQKKIHTSKNPNLGIKGEIKSTVIVKKEHIVYWAWHYVSYALIFTPPTVLLQIQLFSFYREGNSVSDLKYHATD